MSNLRNKIIRLAHENPELRKDLLPLVTKNAGVGLRSWHEEVDYWIEGLGDRAIKILATLPKTHNAYVDYLQYAATKVLKGIGTTHRMASTKTAGRIELQDSGIDRNIAYTTFAIILRGAPTIPEIVKAGKDLENFINGGKINQAVERVCQSYAKDGAKCTVVVKAGSGVLDKGGVVVDAKTKMVRVRCDVTIRYGGFQGHPDFDRSFQSFQKDMQQALSSIR